MPPMTLERIAVQCCKSCAHVLNSDSSETHLRCGLSYYIQPPLTRKQGRMDSFPWWRRMSAVAAGVRA